MIFKDINIRELFQLMQEHDIAETTLQDGKAMVVVKRNKEPVIVSSGAVLDRSYGRMPAEELQQSKDEVKPPEEGGKIEDSKEEKATSPDEASANGYHKVLAPLVGTFYTAPTPDADPFVEVGDLVDVGDVLCIVEAMKSMNEIQSDVKGVIKEVCVENAQLVEFEQVMFRVDTQ